MSGMAIISACSSKTTLSYPEAIKDNTVDTYFGTEVADPYRWLENDTSQATSPMPIWQEFPFVISWKKD